MNIECPICHQAMHATQNPNMFMCHRRKVYVPELKYEMDTVHAMYCIDPASGQPTLKVIEVPPYAFEIHDTEQLKQTRIIKVVDPITLKSKDRYKASSAKYQTTKGPRSFERHNLITVPGAINVQWDNQEAVFDRVRMYMLFS